MLAQQSQLRSGVRPDLNHKCLFPCGFFFCEPESAPDCDLNQPLGALEEASIKRGNKEYDCCHGRAARVSPAALCGAGALRAPELHSGAVPGRIGTSIPCPALPGSPGLHRALLPAPCTRHRRFSQSCSEPSGMPGVFRFYLRCSRGCCIGWEDARSREAFLQATEPKSRR